MPSESIDNRAIPVHQAVFEPQTWQEHGLCQKRRIRMKQETVRQLRFNLSPKQATALRQLQKTGWTISTAQAKLQTTLGSLYKRGFLSISKGFFTITADGEEALRLQSHSEINRSRGLVEAPFAQVLRELTDHSRKLEVVTRKRAERPSRTALTA